MAMRQRCLTAGGFGLLGHRMLNPSHYLVIGRRPLADMAPIGEGTFGVV